MKFHLLIVALNAHAIRVLLGKPSSCHLVELYSPTFPSIELELFGLMWRLLIYLELNFEKIMYLFTFFYMNVYSLTITICGRWFFSSV